MQSKEWKTLDRSGWGAGPWDQEPDKAQWEDPGTGLPCLLVRSDWSGHLCGYVGVPPGHPAHGAEYDNVDVDVHGGLTFAAGCDPSEPEATGVCHRPEPGEPDHAWWLGFDCAHRPDRSPRGMSRVEGTYRDVGFVKAECAKLAFQLAASTLQVSPPRSDDT